MKYLLLMTIVSCISACGATGIDFAAMADAQKAFDKRQHQELVAYMPLGTMFPDAQVRALAKAAGKGDTKKLEELVAQGVDVNSQGKNGATPLFWALRVSNLKGFEALLTLGADPNIIFADASVMHWAAWHKDIRFLQKALSHGGDPNLRAGMFSETPLFNAITFEKNGGMNAMLILLDAGSNINATTQFREGGWAAKFVSGRTPLMTAASVSRFDIVYALLIRGADYRLIDDNGRNLMNILVQADHGRWPADSPHERMLKKCIAWLSERGEVPIPVPVPYHE